MKGYSTKYALTLGIEEVEVHAVDNDTKYVYTGRRGELGTQLVKGRNFFDKKEDAEKEAKKQATKEVVRLRRQLAKMAELEKNPKWRIP